MVIAPATHLACRALVPGVSQADIRRACVPHHLNSLHRRSD
jgi:hypothetical protein